MEVIIKREEKRKVKRKIKEIRLIFMEIKRN